MTVVVNTPGATTVTDIADGIKAVLDTLTVNGSAIYAYDHEPGYDGMDIPAATLFIPDVERPELSEAESQMGADTWDSTWILRLYTGLDDARTEQRQLEVLLADAILAIDANWTLDGRVLRARIVRATSGSVHVQNRSFPLMAYECELEIRRLVDTLYT